jgi:acyl transferase domain-containing protein
MSTVFMCSGQGSHYFQMGGELYLRHSGFRRSMLEMDALVRELTGRSVVEALYDPAKKKSDTFDQLSLSSPALVMVELALAGALREEDVVPDLVLGASMGTFAAAAIAGCIDRDDALRAVVAFARAIETYCVPGAMLVVFGNKAVQDSPVLDTYCELAADSSPTHYTLATPQSHLPSIDRYLRERRATFQKLAVRYAFHSRWIEAARDPFLESIRALPLERPRIPLVCCANARSLANVPQDFLWRAAREPIRFSETIGMLEKSGPHAYIDVGPSASLAALVKSSRASASQSSVHSAMSPYGKDCQALQNVLSNTRTRLSAVG